MIGVATQRRAWRPVDADLDTLATALYVTVDDLLPQSTPPGAMAATGGDRTQAQRRGRNLE